MPLKAGGSNVIDRVAPHDSPGSDEATEGLTDEQNDEIGNPGLVHS
jgi:hypothetical protein